MMHSQTAESLTGLSGSGKNDCYWSVAFSVSFASHRVSWSTEQHFDGFVENESEAISQSQESQKAYSQGWRSDSVGLNLTHGVIPQSLGSHGASSHIQGSQSSGSEFSFPNCNASYSQVPLTEEYDLGCQSLPGGRPLALVASAHFGRFLVLTWTKYFGPLPRPAHALPTRPIHNSHGSQLLVRNKFLRIKPYSLTL